MCGWKTLPTELGIEPYLNDPFTTDEHADARFTSGASQDGAGRWSYDHVGADPLIQGTTLPIESYRQSGWLAFA